MKMSAEDARDIVYGDIEGWMKVSEEIVDNSRWSIIQEGIFHQTETGKHYKVSWSEGATECQDEQPFEYDDEVEFTEVIEEEVMVKKWVPKKKS